MEKRNLMKIKSFCLVNDGYEKRKATRHPSRNPCVEHAEDAQEGTFQTPMGPGQRSRCTRDEVQCQTPGPWGDASQNQGGLPPTSPGALDNGGHRQCWRGWRPAAPPATSSHLQGPAALENSPSVPVRATPGTTLGPRVHSCVLCPHGPWAPRSAARFLTA